MWIQKIQKKVKEEVRSFLGGVHFSLSPFYFMLGACLVYICLDIQHALAVGDNLQDFAAGVHQEVNGISRRTAGTAAAAGLGLMSLGAGNTGKMVAMTGMTGTVGYMLWPMVQRKLMSLSGSGSSSY